jgi:hypothetical protein
MKMMLVMVLVMMNRIAGADNNFHYIEPKMMVMVMTLHNNIVGYILLLHVNRLNDMCDGWDLWMGIVRF